MAAKKQEKMGKNDQIHSTYDKNKLEWVGYALKSFNKGSKYHNRPLKLKMWDLWSISQHYGNNM